MVFVYLIRRPWLTAVFLSVFYFLLSSFIFTNGNINMYTINNLVDAIVLFIEMPTFITYSIGLSHTFSEHLIFLFFFPFIWAFFFIVHTLLKMLFIKLSTGKKE
jgi:hypothetical protein